MAFRVCLFILVVSLTGSSGIAGPKITTGSEAGTYVEFGKAIWEASGFDRTGVLRSAGSVENIQRLLNQKADLAIVQSDVLRTFLQTADELSDPEQTERLRQIRLVVPLYLEEIHILVRSNSEIDAIADLAGKRVNVGLPGSGNSVTAALIKSRLKLQWNDRQRSVSQSIQDVALGEADATVIVGGVPYPQFRQMKPEWRKFVKLIPLHDAPALEQMYAPSVISAESYPWLTQNVPTYAVPSILVAGGHVDSEIVRTVLKIISVEMREDRELTDGVHQKWTELDLGFVQRLPNFGIPVHPLAEQFFSPKSRVKRTENTTDSRANDESAPEPSNP